jgi:hypothetical protein
VLLLLWQLRIFAAAAARPDPTPPPFLGEGSIKKNMKKRTKREGKVNFPSAWRPAGVSDAFSVGLAARRCF